MYSYPDFASFNVLGFGGAIEASILLFVCVVTLGFIGVRARNDPPAATRVAAWSVLVMLLMSTVVVLAVRFYRTGVITLDISYLTAPFTAVRTLLPAYEHRFLLYLFAPFVAILAHFSNRRTERRIAYPLFVGVCAALAVALWQFREPLSAMLRAKGWALPPVSFSQQGKDWIFFGWCFAMVSTVWYMVQQDTYIKPLLVLFALLAGYIVCTA